jgi:hypothetical protein
MGKRNPASRVYEKALAIEGIAHKQLMTLHCVDDEEMYRIWQDVNHNAIEIRHRLEAI